ncbi:MAG: ROK family protein, partial [Boseongicola sp.]|nr:ROK family protein [Boseongicola sp.]
FVGGGLVLNSKVFSGRTGNAAAFGPMPVPNGQGGMTELLNVASLHVLEKSLSDAGIDPLLLRAHIEDWSRYEDHVAPWIESTARGLAIAAATISSVVEVEAILVDGAMPSAVTQRLTEATQNAYRSLDLTAVNRPQIEQARVGRGARSLGAALLPIHARYFLA